MRSVIGDESFGLQAARTKRWGQRGGLAVRGEKEGRDLLFGTPAR